MKYPLEQYQVLKETIETLHTSGVDIEKTNPHALHFEVFQQFSEGHKHNSLIVSDNKLMKMHKLSAECRADNNFRPLITREYEFELYPKGCHDTHVETAVKRAVKEFLTQKS